MNLGVSSASLFACALNEDIPQLFAERGVKHCEIFLESFSEYEADYALLLAERLMEFDIKAVSVHAMSQQFEPQLFSISDRQKNDAENIYRKVLAATHKIGAKHYVMHGPALLVNNTLKNTQLQRIGPICSWLADIAAEYGVKLCFENVSWCLFQYPNFPKDIEQYCESKNFYYTFDIKQAIRSGYDPFDFLQKMHGRVANVHLCDYLLKEGERPKVLMPGQGQFDFEKLFRILKESAYDGDCMIEVYSDMYEREDELFDCYNSLKKLFDQQLLSN